MKTAVIKTGYVGLVSGVSFWGFGQGGVGVDKNPAKVKMLAAGMTVPQYRP